MKMQYKSIVGGAVCVMLSLNACVQQKYSRPQADMAGLYRDMSSADTSTIADMPWQGLFKDVKLQALIKTALVQNIDLKQAIERMHIAEANLKQSRAAFLPSLQVDLSAADARQSKASLNLLSGANTKTETQNYKMQFNASWEIDIWGKLNSSKRAAYASWLQSDAAKRAVQTQLIANIANSYYTLLCLDKQLSITKLTIKSRRENVEAMKSLKDAGRVTGASVVQSEASLYAAEVTVPDLERSIRETEHILQLLLANPPAAIDRSSLDSQKMDNTLHTGIPAQLLENRPDVQAAELAFRAAFENTLAAKRNFYPSITLTANGGLSSLQLKDFFDQSVFYNFIGGLTQPIFAKGQNKMRLKTAQAQQNIALGNFKQSLLNAGSEVSDALYSYQAAVQKQAIRMKQIASLKKAVDFTQELLRYSSTTNYTDVLTSEQGLLSAQLSETTDRLQQLQALVNLYRALGGGWK